MPKRRLVFGDQVFVQRLSICVTERATEVQVLPFASDATIKQLEDNLRVTPAVSDLLAMGMGLEQLSDNMLYSLGVDPESPLERTVEYGPCDKDDLQARLLSLSQLVLVSGLLNSRLNSNAVVPHR